MIHRNSFRITAKQLEINTDKLREQLTLDLQWSSLKNFSFSHLQAEVYSLHQVWVRETFKLLSCLFATPSRQVLTIIVEEDSTIDLPTNGAASPRKHTTSPPIWILPSTTPLKIVKRSREKSSSRIRYKTLWSYSQISCSVCV